jgi:hypothetical protein
MGGLVELNPFGPFYLLIFDRVGCKTYSAEGSKDGAK